MKISNSGRSRILREGKGDRVRWSNGEMEYWS